MSFFRVLVLLVVGLVLSACGDYSKFRTYDGPEVTQVQIHKDERMMYLLHNAQVLASYEVDLGFAPEGHKQFEGDGKTPEGLYYIDRRNPRSAFHLSLGISYPNPADRAFAASQGKRPGGDIFIHGGPQTAADKARARQVPDWTWGCVAVTDREMEEVYAMVRTGTPVWVLASGEASAAAAEASAAEATAEGVEAPVPMAAEPDATPSEGVLPVDPAAGTEAALPVDGSPVAPAAEASDQVPGSTG